MTMPLPRKPVRIDRLFDDPAVVERLLVQHAPYWPVQRYVANRAEYATLSGDKGDAPMVVGPVFRGDWAFDGDVAEGVQPILDHPGLAEAARQVFDAEIVRPHTVYVNLTHQLPFPQGRGHTDIPGFRGFDRTTVPVAFLTIMGQSGLFEEFRVKVATAVAWFYEGDDGGFEYWPDGGDQPVVVHEGGITNTAVVADNDFMWHRVRPTGRPEDGLPSLTLDSQLEHRGEDRWALVDGDRTVAETDRRGLRVSLSWKATLFDDEADRRRHDEHLDDIDLATVLERFRADLDQRGVAVEIPADPLRDPAFVQTLADAYVRFPVGT
jgi:hypothetical protein